MSNPKSLRLLITGICGFAGSTISRHLLEHSPGLSIIGFDNLSRRGSETNVEPLRKLGIDIRIGDVRDRAFLDSLPAADWILDCAANPSVLAGVDGSGTRDLIDQNLYGTVNLLELCKTWKAGFTLLSTSRVYSIPPLANLPLRETPTRFEPDMDEGIDNCSLLIANSEHQSTCSGSSEAETTGLSIGNQQSAISPSGLSEAFSTTPPVSLYGSTKLCSEWLALEYGEAFGFPVWINRCGVLAGAGQFGKADQGIFSYWIHSWRAGRPLKYIGFGGTGKQVRDCLHPKDLVPLLLKQFQTNAQPATRNASPLPRIVNCSGGASNSMSLLELSQWCARRFPGNSKNSSLLIDNSNQLAADPAKLERPGFPSEISNQQSAISSRPFDIPWMVLDPALAAETWQWKPTTPIHDILEEIAQHAEANPNWIDLVT